MRRLVGGAGGFGCVALRSGIVVCALAGSFVLALCLAGAATAGAAGWSIQTTPNPRGTLDTGLYSVSCASATVCNAVGDAFFDRGGDIFAVAPLAERWVGAGWSIQTTPDPTRASQDGESGLYGASCASLTACSAVGFQANGTTAATAPEMTLAEQWNAGGWSIQTIPNPPTTIQTTDPLKAPTGSQLNGVSCPSTTACAAVGLSGGTGTDLPLAERWDGVSWSIQTTPTPAGATGGELNAVSCTSPTVCTAVGFFSGRAGKNLPLAERWDGVSWSIQTTPNPARATDTTLLGVSCTSTTACTAVGSFAIGVEYLTLAERWNGVSWSIQTTSNHAGGAGVLDGVSCSSVSACTAVGASSDMALAERWNGGGWSIQAAPNPAGATSSRLLGVSCTSTTACTAVGGFSRAGPAGDLTLAERWNGRSRKLHTAILGGTAFVSPSGVAGVFLGCFAARPCRGSMAVKHADRLIAHRNAYTIPAADGGIVHLSLSSSARRSLAHGRVAVTIQIADTSGLRARASVMLVPFGNVATARLAAVGPSRIGIFGHTGFVSPSGIAEVFLGCFGNQSCTGTITLTEGHTTIASRRGTLVAADNGALVHIPINARGRKLLVRHTIRVKVSVREPRGQAAFRTLSLEHFR